MDDVSNFCMTEYFLLYFFIFKCLMLADNKSFSGVTTGSSLESRIQVLSSKTDLIL